jgi:hypothetical protein
LGVSERIIGISIIFYGKNSLDFRPTWVRTSPRERIEFVSQGPTVELFLITLGLLRGRMQRVVRSCAYQRVDSRRWSTDLFTLLWLYHLRQITGQFSEGVKPTLP